MAVGTGSVRVDKWLWAVRAYRTRTVANEACTAGRVTVNGEPAKPATKVAVGDLVTARRRDRTISYEVVVLLEKRVSAQKAAEAINDVSPPLPERTDGPFVAADGRRDRGEGRPTKRERRQLDRLRGRRR